MYEEQEIRLQRILTDRGTEYKGKIENHPYQLYLDLEDIDHTTTKAKSPQTNGICERFHRTVQEEFYSIIFRKKVFTSVEELQADLNEWIDWYNTERTHSGKHCYGKTPWQTMLDSKHLALEKQLDQLPWRVAEAHSIDKSLLGNQSEGLAIEGDFVGEQNKTTTNLTKV